MTTCKSCGAEISSSAKACPKCGARQKRPIYLRVWFWVVIVLALMGIAASAGGNSDARPVQSVQTLGPAGTPAGSPAAEPMEPGNIFAAGTAVETNVLRLQYESCETDWTGYNTYLAPEKGHKIVRAYFSFENISDRDQSVGSAYFSCYADDAQCDAYYFSGDGNLTSIATLSPGRTASGYVYFEVPQNASSIELEYETSFWSQDKLIFTVE